MAQVTIILDDSSGELEMGMRMEGTFNPESKAHQMANMLLNYMDSIADRNHDKVEDIEVAAGVPDAPSLIYVPGQSLMTA